MTESLEPQEPLEPHRGEAAGIPVMGDMDGASDGADSVESEVMADADSGVVAAEVDFLEMRLEDLIDDPQICVRLRALFKSQIEIVKDIPELWSTIPYWGLREKRQHASVSGHAQAVNRAAGRAIATRRAKFNEYEAVNGSDQEQARKIGLDNIALGAQITGAIQPVVNRCRTLMDALFASLTQE